VFRLAFPFPIAEIESGIATAARKEALRKAASLTAWLEAILHLYGRRVLSLDTTIARTAGCLDDFARSAGMSPGFADIAIAATASTHGLIILTRDLRHFQPLGLSVLDPLGGSLP
jgi:toxin FitB